MIQARTITLGADPAPLSDYFPASRGAQGIQLQAVDGSVFYGSNASQAIELQAGDLSSVLPVSNLRDFYLKGSGITLNVLVIM